MLSAVLLLCGLAGHAHAADNERVRAVFSSEKPAAVIAVPGSFLSPETIADEGESETQADWATYLNRWVAAVKGEVEVVVVPMEALADALRLPDPTPSCVSLFRRSNGAVLRYDEDCVVGPDIYEAATHWLQGENASGPAGEALKKTLIHIRQRCGADEVEVPLSCRDAPR